MKKKRLLAMVMSFIMLIGMMSAAFPASALVSGIGNVTLEDVTKTEELTVVTPVSEYDTVTDTTVLHQSADKTEFPFTTEFDYSIGEESSTNLIFDTNYAVTFSENYDSEDAVAPEGTQLLDDNGDKYVDYMGWNGNVTAEIAQTNGNYRAEFYLKSSNEAWDTTNIYLRDDLILSFYGSSYSGTGAYTGIIRDSSGWLTSCSGFRTINNGAWIRIDYFDGNVKVYVSAENDFTDICPILQYTADGLSDEGTLKIYKRDGKLFIDDVTVYNLEAYTDYNEVKIENNIISVNNVSGATVSEYSSATLSGDCNIAVMRNDSAVKVYADSELLIDTAVSTDYITTYGSSVAITASEGAVSDVNTYDTTNIIFSDGYALPIAQSYSDTIDIASSSHSDAKISWDGSSSYSLYASDTVNANITTTSLFKEAQCDFDLSFRIQNSRDTWIYDNFYFRDENGNGFNVNFNINGEAYMAAQRFSVVGSGVDVEAISQVEANTFAVWGDYISTVHFVRKGDNFKVYFDLAGDGLIGCKQILFGEYTIKTFAPLNMQHFYQQGGTSSTVKNIKLYDTSNISTAAVEIKDAEYTEDYAALTERIGNYLETVSASTRFSISSIAEMKSVYETMKELEGTKENYQTLISYWNTFLNSGNANSRVLLISDTHTADLSSVLELGEELEIDGLMHMGDITQHGTPVEYTQTTDILDNYSRFNADNIFITPGNHDIGDESLAYTSAYNATDNSAERAQYAIDTYLAAMADYLPEGLTVPYYSGQIGNMSIIVLSRERTTKADIGITDEQISFLKSELEKAGTDNPILINLHETLAVGSTLVGPTSYQKLVEAVEGYDNVIFFTGHKHTALSAGEQVYTDSGYINVNMPSMGYQGTGYVLEEYVDNLVLRAVDFTTGTWLTEYDLELSTKGNDYEVNVAVPVAELESAPESGTPVYEKDLSNFSLSFEYYSDSDATWYFDSVDGDKNNCYQLTLSGGTISLDRIVAGTPENLGTYDGLDTDGYYGIQVVRYMDSIRVFVNESEVLAVAAEDAAYPVTTTGSNTHWYGKLYLEDTDGAVKNIKVYDSGLITFTAGQPVLDSIELADDIGLYRSTHSNTGAYCNSTEDSVTLYTGSGSNPAAYSDYWLDSDVGDFIMTYDTRFSQLNYTNQAIIFSAKKSESYSTNIGYFYSFESKTFDIKNVYDYADVLCSGASGGNMFYRLTTVTSFGNFSDEVKPVNTGVSTHNHTVKIVKKANTLTVYYDDAEVYNGTSDIPAGNIAFALFQGTAEVTNIKISDTENSLADSVDYLATTNPAPVAEVKTENVGALSINLDAVAGYEYSINGTDYVTNPEFTGLADETEYTLYQRIAATESYNASDIKELSVITALLVGDIDNDNLIDSVDITMLRKHIIKSELIEDTRTADADGSEEINIKDLVRMKKYLADPYNVTLGK